MNKEITKKFIGNNGFICKNCGKIVIDGKKHKNEEYLCGECCVKEMQRLKTELSAKVEYIHELLEIKEDYKKQLSEIKNDYLLLEEQLENANDWNKELLHELEVYKQNDNIYAKNMSRLANRHNQCEKSFAIKQLEKALDTIENVLDDALKNNSCNSSYYDKLLDLLDKQIKGLEEKK